MNDIPAEQNQRSMLALLRAKSGAYDRARLILVCQFALLVLLPLGAAAWQVANPSMGWLPSMIALGAFATDSLMLDPVQKRAAHLGARFQEMFDCRLFRLKWEADRNGATPTAEEVDRWSGRHPSTDGLLDWYSPSVAALPLSVATVVCQRTNAYWNASMRRRYVTFLKGSGAALLAIMVVAAVVADSRVVATIKLAALALPVGRWGYKEVRQQGESASASEHVRQRAEKLWRRILGGDPAHAELLTIELRQLQNDIFDQRRRNPPIFSWVYSRWREEDEREMNIGAEALAAEFLSTRA